MEQFRGSQNAEFNAALSNLAARLRAAAEAASARMGLDEIACAQNFDGSFWCGKYKTALSPVALRRLLKEGDIFVYERQIKKAINFLNHATLSETESKQFEECKALAEKVGVASF